MFEAGRNTDEATLACAGESDLAAAASVFTRGERQHMARKILAAYHLGVKVFDRVMAADYDRYRKKMPDKAAVRDVAWHFAVPPATAGRWMALGELLSSLPKIRAAFLDGDLSESRASLLAHAVIALDETQYGAAEDAALGYAAEASTNSVLAEQLDEMVIALDPDRAEQARHAYAARTQDVRFRKDLYGQVNISATLDLVDARTLQARISALVAVFLCRNDKRPASQQRADALVALIHDRTTMDCTCGSPDCAAPANRPPAPEEPEPGEPQSQTPGDEDVADDGVDIDADVDVITPTLDVDPDAPQPDEPTEPEPGPESEPVPSTEVARMPVRVVVEVVTDALTLAGMTGQMVPYIKGYGVITPVHARELATDATWQGMYRESQRFAHRTDPTTPESTSGLLRPGRPRQGGTIIVPTHLTSTDGGGTGSIVVRSRPPNPHRHHRTRWTPHTTTRGVGLRSCGGVAAHHRSHRPPLPRTLLRPTRGSMPPRPHRAVQPRRSPRGWLDHRREPAPAAHPVPRIQTPRYLDTHHGHRPGDHLATRRLRQDHHHLPLSLRTCEGRSWSTDPHAVAVVRPGDWEPKLCCQSQLAVKELN